MANTAPDSDPISKPRRRRWILASGMAALLIVCACAAYFAVGGPTGRAVSLWALCVTSTIPPQTEACPAWAVDVAFNHAADVEACVSAGQDDDMRLFQCLISRGLEVGK